jgi:Mrp family chromosome partitioning ATPase
MGTRNRLMVDLTHEMAELYQGLTAGFGPVRAHQGRVLMFVGALGGEGVSSVAREYARCEAAMAQKPVWLIDADLAGQSQLDIAMAEVPRFGPAGPLSQASPDGSVFFRVEPRQHDDEGRDVPDADYLVARPFFEHRLWVTQLRSDALNPGQRVVINEDGRYFAALRRHVQSVIVDVPALERSKDALLLAPRVDGVIMVVSEDRGSMSERRDARDALAAVGGKVIGVVYNRAREVDARLKAQKTPEGV